MSRRTCIILAIAAVIFALNIWHSPRWIWVGGPFLIVCVLWYAFANKAGFNAKDSRGYVPPEDGGSNSMFKD